MADQEPRIEKVKLRDIVPNPLGDIPLSEETVDQLVTQYRGVGFHNYIKGRRGGNGKVQIAFGHHRIAALRKLYGDDYEVDLDVHNLTNADMIKELAGDNDFSFTLNLKKFDKVVRSARDELQSNPELLRETLSSEVQDNNRERVRPGAPAIAKFLHKKLSQVQLALERVNAIDDGVIHPDALYLMRNPHLADMFINLMKGHPSVDKKYHVPIAKHIIQSGARNDSDMWFAFYMACRSLDKKELTYFDPDYGYNKTFKRLAGTMSQLRQSLFYLPTQVSEFFSEDKKRISDSIRLKDLSTFRAHLIGLGKDLAYMRKYIESKVPVDVWTQEEVKPTVRDYKALLAKTEQKQGKDAILKTGELLKYFGLHKTKDVPWGMYYLWQVKDMIKEGKFYYKLDKKGKQEKSQVASKAKQKKSRSRSSH